MLISQLIKIVDMESSELELARMPVVNYNPCRYHPCMQHAPARKQVAMDRNFEFTASYLATFVGETTLPRKVEVEDPNEIFI